MRIPAKFKCDANGCVAEQEGTELPDGWCSETRGESTIVLCPDHASTYYDLREEINAAFADLRQSIGEQELEMFSDVFDAIRNGTEADLGIDARRQTLLSSAAQLHKP